MATKCGNGVHVESPYWLKDARGIEVAKVCDACVEEVKAGYRPEIFTDPNYETTEDVEPDGPSLSDPESFEERWARDNADGILRTLRFI